MDYDDAQIAAMESKFHLGLDVLSNLYLRGACDLFLRFHRYYTFHNAISGFAIPFSVDKSSYRIKFL